MRVVQATLHEDPAQDARARVARARATVRAVRADLRAARRVLRRERARLRALEAGGLSPLAPHETPNFSATP